MNYLVSGATDMGTVKKTNQDSFFANIINTEIGQVAFAVLCDGMGGLEKGELASASVVNAFNVWSKNRLPQLCTGGLNDSVISHEWTNIIVTYNEKLKQYGQKSAVRLGTTATAMLVTEQRWYIVHVGDSRAYEIYDGVRVLTKDQTLIEQEILAGRITEQQAQKDPRRSILLQCVGASDEVYPDMYFGDTIRNAVYMLCSDGFRHEITENEIYSYFRPEVMVNTDTMKMCSNELINLNKQRGEKDNISVVTIRTY